MHTSLFLKKNGSFFTLVTILGSFSALILQVALQPAQASGTPISAYTTAWNVATVRGLTLPFGNEDGKSFLSAIGPSSWQTATCITSTTGVTLNQPDITKLSSDAECSIAPSKVHATVTQVTETWSVSTWTPPNTYAVKNNSHPTVQEWDIPRATFDANSKSTCATNCITTYRSGLYGAFAPGNDHGDPNNYTWASEFPLTWQVKGYIDEVTL